jgi:hypothetical protein
MKRATVFLIMFAALQTSISKATIINIPADYITIQEGINASSNGDTVLVQPGNYEENINFTGHNITLGSLFLTTGDENYIQQTIIDGDSAGTVVTFDNGETNAAVLTGFTIRAGLAFFGAGIFCTGSSPVVSHNIITENEAYQQEQGEGGGIAAVYSNMILLNNVITANYATGALGGYGGGVSCGYSNILFIGNDISGNTAGWGGGGIYCYSSAPTFYNNTITKNRGIFYGGGLYLDEASPMLVNNTFSENIARWVDGGAMYIVNNSNPVITNTILWADSALEDGDELYIEFGSPILSYCNIEGGWGGTGNIDSFPMFRDPENGDFHLMSTDCGNQDDSPCIDAGDPMIVDSLLDCMGGLGLASSDMGAYGGGDSVSTAITDITGSMPDQFLLSQNYPNPFNAKTVIRFVLPESGNVRLTIYDLLGREVETLLDEFKAAGVYNVSYDASNIASGIYLYRIDAAGYSQTRAMQLIK